MSKWTYQPGVDAATGKHFIYDADGEMTSGEWIGEACDEETARQIVREHKAHAELVLCLKAMLKITCGECRGGKSGKHCPPYLFACDVSSQARAAIEAAEGKGK